MQCTHETEYVCLAPWVRTINERTRIYNQTSHECNYLPWEQSILHSCPCSFVPVP